MADATIIISLLIFILLIFIIGLAIAYKIGHREGCFRRDKYWEGELPHHRKDAILRSRAVLGGNFSEQLAPYLPNFEFLPNECRFIGKPIDLVVFKGMDEKKINEIVFVEVKSGNAKLSPQEENLKEVVKQKKVRWEEYRIPKELTEKGDIEDKIQSVVNHDYGNGEKKFVCSSCGRPIRHKGKCLACNMKAKGKKK